MLPNILLIKHPDGYRVLHGHLHLSSMMARGNLAVAHASGEGKVKVIKTAEGLFVGDSDRRLPLLLNQ
jgi:hypothetical protein